MSILSDEDKKDCERIQQIAMEHGWSISWKVAGLIWADHSDDWCASWLVLPKEDEQIWHYVKEYM